MLRLATIALLSALVSPVVGQKEAVPAAKRLAHPGRVITADGQPVAAAEVTFLSGADGLGTLEDVVRTTTRDNGRFRVQLLRGREYRAFAVAKAGTLLEHAPTASLVVDRGKPVTEIRFPAGELRRARQDLAIRGVQAWREHGEVRVEAWFEGCRQTLSDPVHQIRRFRDAEDYLDKVLPPLPISLPGVNLDLAVYVGGKMVYATTGSGDFQLPPPFVVRGRVVDAEDKPVVGARIYRVDNRSARMSVLPRRDLARRFLVAETDQDGRAEWLVAARRDPFTTNHGRALAFVAEADGFRGSVAAITREVMSGEEIITDEVEDRTLPFVLKRAPAQQVVVTGDVQVTGVAWASSYKLKTGEFSYYTHFDARLGGELVAGKATVRLWPEYAREPRLYLYGVTPKLAPDDPFARSVASGLLEVIRPDLTGPIQIRAAQIVPLRVQLLTADGAPASGVEVACVSLENGIQEPLALPAAADTAGRVVMPRMPGRYLLVSIHGRDWVQQEVEIAAGMAPLELRLQPMAQMRLRVVDPTGKPIAGARLANSSWSTGSVQDPVQAVLQEFAQRLHSSLRVQFQSEQDGRLILPLISVSNHTAKFRVEFGELSSDEYVLHENEDFEDVELKQ